MPRGTLIAAIVITAIVVGAAVAVTIPAITPPAAERTVTRTATQTTTQTTTQTATVTAERTVERTATVRTTVTATVTPTPPPKEPTIRIGFTSETRTFNHFIDQITIEFLEKMGYKVEWALMGVRPGVSAFLAREVDFIVVTFNELAPAIEGGEPIIAIAPAWPLNYEIVSTREVQTLADLEGKQIGVSRIGAISYVIPFFMVKEAGVDPDAVEWISVGGTGARIAALIAGRIDAGIAYGEVAARTLRQPEAAHLHRLTSVAEFFAPLKPDGSFWEIYADFAEEHPQAVKDFVKARILAEEWIQTNRDEYVSKAIEYIYGEFKPEEVAFYTELYNDWVGRGILFYDRVDPAEIQLMNELAIMAEIIKEPLPTERWMKINDYINLVLEETAE